MSRYIVGLTGGIGSGKSAVAELFHAHGIVIVDADAINHELIGPDGAAMQAIAAEFGTHLVTENGALDRTAMRALVFADTDARRRLEAILHPRIRALCAERCAAAQSPYVVLMVPLLIESGAYRERCHRLLVVDCPEDVQIKRVMTRNGLTRQEVERIMAAQASRAERLAAADDVVDNSGTPDALPPQVAVLHDKYLTLSGGNTASVEI